MILIIIPIHLKQILKYYQKQTATLFLPYIKEIYPDGIKYEKTVFKYRDILCDLYRLGHFDGVTTIVKILFNLIEPGKSFLVRKIFSN